MSQFGLVTGANASNFGKQSYNQAVSSTMKHLEANSGFQPNKNMGEAVVRMENRNNPEAQTLKSQLLNTSNQLAQSIVDSLDLQGNPADTPSAGLQLRSEAMAGRALAAANLGFALAAGYQGVQGRELNAPSVGQGGKLMNAGALGSKMTLRQEAFNNIDVHKSVAYSLGFNAAITRQTDLVMAWFPPIFINPDQISLEISLNLLTVFNGAYHEISGEKTNFERRNVARAFADPTVLNRYETLVVPVSRPESVGKLVADAVIPHTEKTFGNRVVKTAPYLFNQDINLIGISTSDALLKTGAPGHRDVIEPGAKVSAIYFKSGDNVISLKTAGLKTSMFIGAQQGDQMETILNMRTNVAVGKNLKRYDGIALTGDLALLESNDLRVKLAIQMSGVINVETTNAKVTAPTITLVEILDVATGQKLTSGAAFTALSNAIKAIEPLGYDLVTYRTNANRRQVGDRINTRRFNYHYVVPYRDPITAERPAHKQEEQDAQDLTNLQALTRIRIENEAVDQIIDTAETMASYVDMRDTDAEATDLLGLAQFYLIPTFVKDHIDLRDHVDSLKSSERSRDIQQALVIKLRDIVTRMYTDSQFKAGTDVQSGGTLPVPQVNVLTDPIIARYLMIDGELRTLGDFEMVLTTTLNYKVRGQIFLSFRMPGQESANEPCIFNFGHLVMSPELVLAANMTREGSYFAETQVQPRYEFIVLNPVMAHLTVDGVKEVLSKIPQLTTLTDPLKIDGVVQMEQV